MWRIKTTKDGVWLGRWILHSATQFHPFSTLPWDDQYPLHHRAIDQSLREGNRLPLASSAIAFDGMLLTRIMVLPFYTWGQARSLSVGASIHYWRSCSP